MLGGYRDLEIYQLSHKLAIEIHQMSLTLPRYEMYEEGSQIRRSSKAIPSNIVEGFGRRRYPNEFLRFLVYALSSCDETQEHLKLLYDTKSLADELTYDRLRDMCDHAGRMLINFMTAIERAHFSPKNSSNARNSADKKVSGTHLTHRSALVRNQTSGYKDQVSSNEHRASSIEPRASSDEDRGSSTE